LSESWRQMSVECAVDASLEERADGTHGLSPYR
jgi:hypothetical protein